MTRVVDPVPEPLSGTPSVVGAKASVMTATADALRTAIQELRTLSSETVTISEAVDEVRVKADGVRADIDKVEQRYRGAAEAMAAYKTGLSAAQQRADNARARIVQNNADAAYWRKRENTIVQLVQSGEKSEELLAELLKVQSKVNLYASEYSSAMAEYWAAEGDKENAVAAAISALVSAAEAAKLDDGFWDKVGAVLEYAYEWAQVHLAPLIEKLRAVLEIIKGIVDILALVVGVLSLFLPFLAPLAVALTLASLGLAASIMLCSLALFALGKESLGRVLSDAIGVATSILTSKMGGLNVFKPAAKLEGLGNVLKPSVWQQGMQMAKFDFAITAAVNGTREAVATYGLDVMGKLFPPDRTAVKLISGIGAGFVSSGLDITHDLFPEGGAGGMFGPFEGGWDVTGDEALKSVFKPITNVVSGGVSNPSIAIVNGVNTLTAGAS